MLKMTPGFLHDHKKGGAKNKQPNASHVAPESCIQSPHFGRAGHGFHD